MAELVTLYDTFDRAALGAAWTASGASIIGNALAVNAAYSGGPVYSSARSAAGFTWSGSQLAFELTQVPARTSTSGANAQLWIRDPAPAATVDRIGFEIAAPAGTGTITITCIGQTGASYSPIGTTTTLTYDAVAMRWLRLRHTGTSVVWETSPTGLPGSWVVRRTLTSPPAWTTKATLQVSIEAFRNQAGTTDTVRVDNVNATPAPAWTVDPAATGGVVTWALDYSKADAVAGGCRNADWNRQDAAGNGASSALPWPPPIDVAPFGKPGRCVPLRLRDSSKRYELEPALPADLGDGDSAYFGFAFAFDGDLDLNASGYQVVWQLRPYDDAGSPPVALEVMTDGGLWITGGYGRQGAPAAGTYSFAQRLGGVKARTWYSTVIFVGANSTPGTGRVDLWIGGARLLTNFAPPPGTNYPAAGGKSYPKNGLYHDPANRGATIFFAEQRVGTSYLAVAPTLGAYAYGGFELLASA